MGDLHARIVSVAVSALPEDHPSYSHYVVLIRWVGGEDHVVEHLGCYLYDDTPRWRSGRTTAARYDYNTAYRLACEWAPKVAVNGRTALDVLGQAADA